MKTAEEKLATLTFYGTGDEAYEEFSAGCRFYRILGATRTELSKLLFEWLEEAAKNTYWEYAKASILDTSDKRTGEEASYI